MDLAGAPLNVSARLGVASVKVANVPTNVVLAKPLASSAGLTTRAEIFQNSTIATGAPGGWVPAPHEGLEPCPNHKTQSGLTL